MPDESLTPIEVIERELRLAKQTMNRCQVLHIREIAALQERLVEAKREAVEAE